MITKGKKLLTLAVGCVITASACVGFLAGFAAGRAMGWLSWKYFTIFAVLLACYTGVTSAQTYDSTPGGHIDAGSQTVEFLDSGVLDINTPKGAFVAGFMLVTGFYIFGWCLRQVKWIGHRG